MNHVRAVVGLALTAALGGLVAFAMFRTDRAAAEVPIEKTTLGGRPWIAVGSAGCSGSACHGAPIRGDLPTSPWGGDLDRWKTSYEVWRHYDPHARAYRVLIDGDSGKVSAEIERKLAAGKEPLNAWEDTRCLACHSNPNIAVGAADRSLRAEGVSCEACHGTATKYLYDHIGWVSGPDHHAKFKPAGMTELFDPAVRAETCAGCHVGAPGRDMNHDLIAAGHPRLNFEYATYLRALPPHWTEKDRTVPVTKARPAGEIAHHWLVGRAATAAAAGELLADRAARADQAPWPELSEFDCYACHHNLVPKAFRERVPDDAAGRKPGSLVWNETVFASELIEFAGDAKLRETHGAVRSRMNGTLDRDAVAPAAKAAADEWRRVAGNWAGGPAIAAGVVAEKLQGLKVRRWDDAAHGYYALRALDAARDVEYPELARLRTALRLPRAGFNSPTDFDPVRERFDFRTWFEKRR